MVRMRIKELRLERGLTLSDIANALGVTVAAVSLWETHINMPTSDKLPALAGLLGCTIDELYESAEKVG